MSFETRNNLQSRWVRAFLLPLSFLYFYHTGEATSIQNTTITNGSTRTFYYPRINYKKKAFLLKKAVETPEYFFENFSLYIDSNLFDKGDIYTILDSILKKVDSKVILKFILNNKLEKYLNVNYIDKIFYASFNEKQMNIFYTLLSYNFSPTLYEVADVDPLVRQIMLEIDNPLIQMLNNRTLKLKKLSEDDWNFIKEGLLNKFGHKNAGVFLRHLENLSKSYENINPIFIAQSIWLIAKLANYYIINYSYDIQTAIKIATWSYIDSINNSSNERVFMDNILLVDHTGKWFDNSDRFAKKALREALKNKTRTFLYLNEEWEPDTRKDLLLQLVAETPKLTFYFDGHGSDTALYLNGGEVLPDGTIKDTHESIKITVKDLAKALDLRSKLLKKEDYEITIILASCFSNNFAYKLLLSISELTPVPNIITMSEYSQYGYSVYGNKYGSTFNEILVKMQDNNLKSLLFETFKPKNMSRLLSNPSIFTKGPVNPGGRQAFGVPPKAIKLLRFLQLG